MAENIFIAVIDGLRASALGAYGNTTYGTTALDCFAADSFLLDWCYATSPDLPDIYRSLWQSRITGRKAGVQPLTLPRLFADHGYDTTLITDELLLSSFAVADDFAELVEIAQVNSAKRAKDVSDTGLARLFGATLDQLAGRESDKPSLIWLHARGMYGPWDAPLALQQLLLDDGDPPPVESVAPPDLEWKPTDDPDIAFRFATAYAAQVMVLDACWQTLFDAINASNQNPWLITLVGARGFALGEHGRIGGIDPRVYGEQVHVPWLVRFPNHRGRLARSGALTSHVDLLPTLFDWLGRPQEFSFSAFDGMSMLPLGSNSRSRWRDFIVSTSATAHSIRTASWCLREDFVADRAANESSEPEPPELFVRPDDRWEANDVARLCPEVIEDLRTLAAGS
jgi:arylsulfatase A-like enzyme